LSDKEKHKEKFSHKEIQNGGDDTLKRYLKRAVNVTHMVVHEMVLALKEEGFQTVVALKEADSIMSFDVQKFWMFRRQQLALPVSSYPGLRKVSFVISDDSDQIAYLKPFAFFKMWNQRKTMPRKRNKNEEDHHLSPSPPIVSPIP